MCVCKQGDRCRQCPDPQRPWVNRVFTAVCLRVVKKLVGGVSGEVGEGADVGCLARSALRGFISGHQGVVGCVLLLYD